MSNRLKCSLLAVGAIGFLAACSDGDATVEARNTPAPAAAPAVPADPQAPSVVQTAVTSDIMAIDASRVALERSQNWDVKQLAQKVIDTRSKAGGELKMTLSQANLSITPKTALPQDKAATVAELRTAEPAQVDKLYLTAQVQANEQALEVLEKYAEEGSTPALKAFAEKTAPELREQQQATRALLNRIS